MASIFESASFPFLIETTSHCIALSRPVLSLWSRSLTTPDGRRRWRRCINASQVTRENRNPSSLYYHYEIKLSRARIAPVAQGKWIGNFDILRTMNEKFEFGYPGASSTCQEGQMLIQVCHQVMVWTNLLKKRGSLSICAFSGLI